MKIHAIILKQSYLSIRRIAAKDIFHPVIFRKYSCNDLNWSAAVSRRTVLVVSAIEMACGKNADCENNQHGQQREIFFHNKNDLLQA